MYLVLLMPLLALALLFQEASAPLGPPDFAGAEATSTYVVNHYWPEAVNPMHSRHLANGRYGFRSKFPMVGDPLRSLMARAQTDGRKSGNYDICVLHDEGKGGLMTIGIERVIRNFVRYTIDETNPILMSLRGLVAEAPKLVPRELREAITDHRCDLKDRQGSFSHGALEPIFQSGRDRLGRQYCDARPSAHWNFHLRYLIS